mmetsp:Transcript_22411/g.42737  ORF Transcript_22411/g.42737 Transcript_22411/m.42737 type:complete len:380 (-) Transcript_22411:920-2059(-)
MSPLLNVLGLQEFYDLVDLLNLGSTCTPGRGGRGSSITPHATHVRHSSWHTSTCLVHLGHNRIADALKLLELVLKLIHLSKLIGLQPLNCLLNLFFDLLLVISIKLATNLVILNGVPHVVRVILQCVLGIHLLLVLLVLCLVLLSLLDHAFNLLLGKAALVIGDGDLVLLAGGLVLSRHIEDTIGINVEAHIDLGNTSGCRRDSRQLKLAQEVVITCSGAFAFKHLDQDSGLVVCICGEHLLLLGWNGGVAWDQNSHHSSSCLQSQGQRSDIQKKQVLHLLRSLTREDGCLHSCSICYCLIGVDALAQFLPVEEVREQRLDLGDTGGSTDKNNFMHCSLVHLGIAQHLLNRFHALPEEVHVHLLKTGTGDRCEEVHTLE